MLKFPREKRNELHELDRAMRVVGTLPCGLLVYVRTDEHAYAPHVHICDIKTRGCRFHACVLLTEWQYFIHPWDEYPYCEGRRDYLRHVMIEQCWPAWRDTLNRTDRQWEQEQEWDWKLLPDAFCDNEDFRHWCAERNPSPWHDFKMSVRQENKGMMEEMIACAEKNEWANFLLLADVCGPDTVRRVFCQCVVDRNDEAVVGIVHACAKARITLPLRELAFECIGWGPKDAIEILKAIEETSPGMCAALYDRFGRGLLWYSTYLDPETTGEKFQPFSRQNALAQFLLQCGCDPARENVNCLAWEDLLDA